MKHHPVKEVLQPNAPLRHDAALIALQKVLPPNTVFTSDIGEHAIFAIHYLKIYQPDAFLVAAGLGSMGSGIGAAVGAKLALTARPVVAVCVCGLSQRMPWCDATHKVAQRAQNKGPSAQGAGRDTRS